MEYPNPTINIFQAVNGNANFRAVHNTGPHLQSVKMCLTPNQNIGKEQHPDTDQIFIIINGEGTALVDDKKYLIKPGSMVTVHAGQVHDIVNTSSIKDLRFLTIYSSPEHDKGAIHRTKKDAEKEAPY